MNVDRIIEIFPYSSGVSTDSRTVSAGNIFFALRGENFDGNEYAEQALKQGAICAVVERSSRFIVGKDIEEDSRFILVDNTLKAIQELAKWYRSQFQIPIIAITGTNGKTTTKELVKGVLSKKFKVLATCGNLNNSIGVPKTLFGLNNSYQIAIIEMGASHIGDIKELVEIALPNFGLITNVGEGHLLGFKSFDGVVKTKGELFDFLNLHTGRAFINGDDKTICKMADDRDSLQTTLYGERLQQVKVAPATLANPYLSFSIGETTVNTHLVGRYNIYNALAAIAIGEYFGVEIKDCLDAISEYIPENNRSQLLKKGSNLLIIDAYNANPTSMRASLLNFKETPYPNKVLILGDMRELGDYATRAHNEILEQVMEMEFEKAFFVGEEFSSIKGSLQNSMIGDKIFFFDNVDILSTFLDECPVTHSAILIKGSNSIKLPKVVEKL